MMFIGSYYHALEQKGRLSIPAAFRKQLGKTLVITLGLDGGLLVFSETEWKKVTKADLKLPFTSKMARDFVRIMTNNAQLVEVDSQGRILISERLRNKGELKKQVVIVGSLSRVEIWDQDLYHQYLDSIEATKETIAESISDLTAHQNNNETSTDPT